MMRVTSPEERIHKVRLYRGILLTRWIGMSGGQHPENRATGPAKVVKKNSGE
jgi:hypothetical protein